MSNREGQARHGADATPSPPGGARYGKDGQTDGQSAHAQRESRPASEHLSGFRAYDVSPTSGNEIWMASRGPAQVTHILQERARVGGSSADEVHGEAVGRSEL